MKKTYETHLNEKEETIQSLHEIIEEQDNKIIELHSKMIGESSTDSDENISIYRSVKKLVDKLSHLQSEKANLTSSLMKTQGRMSKMETEHEEKLNQVEEEKKSLERMIRKLEKEIRDLKVCFMFSLKIHSYHINTDTVKPVFNQVKFEPIKCIRFTSSTN